MHPRAEERLIGVDVADTGDPPLVEQERLDGGSPASRQRPEVLGREALLERLQSEPGREEGLECVRSQQQLSGAEATWVHYREPDRLPWRMACPALRVGGVGARARTAPSSSAKSGRDQRQSRISMRLRVRPSTSGASWLLIVSTSGSSGMS